MIARRALIWELFDTGGAQGEECHPVHRRWHVDRPPHGGADPVEGHRRRPLRRRACHRRHASHGAGLDLGHRLRSLPTAPTACRPTRPAINPASMRSACIARATRRRSTIPRSRPSGKSSSARRGMSVGVVTNTEIEDATPAGMVAHTRRRSDYNDIVKMFFAVQPEVIHWRRLAELSRQVDARLEADRRGRLHREVRGRRATSSSRPRPNSPRAGGRRQGARALQYRQRRWRARPSLPQEGEVSRNSPTSPT